MPKIQNMGRATVKFNEGVIISGSAGETSDSLIISGTTIFKDDAQMEANKKLYFDGNSVANGPFIYGNTTAIFIDGDDRVTLQMDKDFRILDANNNNIVHVTDKDATDNSVYSEFSDVNIFFSGSANSKDGNKFGAALFGGDLIVSGNYYVEGTITTTNDISFQDNGGTFPTNTAGFFWDLNNDEARIYAKQPASDQIDFVFKLSDNNNSVDRFVYWIDDYRGGSYDRYPLVMHGQGVFFQSPESSEGVPDIGNSKARFDSQGRLAFNCQNQTDPTGSPPLQNHAHIYSKLDSGTAEMFVQDSDGNVTKISPHNPEGEWEYFSRNTVTGKVVRVNMEKMIRKLEEITGESFMEEWYEDLDDI